MEGELSSCLDGGIEQKVAKDARRGKGAANGTRSACRAAPGTGAVAAEGKGLAANPFAYRPFPSAAGAFAPPGMRLRVCGVTVHLSVTLRSLCCLL